MFERAACQPDETPFEGRIPLGTSSAVESATLTDFIRRDLSARLRADGGAPVALTLPSLSKHYRVSMTPVRLAVRELVADGVLIRGRNGRLEANAALLSVAGSRSRRPPAVEPPRSADDLERAITRELIFKSLRGETDYLREEAFAARHKVGRTAIRQAFGRLAGRGLIEHEPRKGRRVRVFDQAGLDSYLEVREVLELKALDLCRDRLDPTDLKRMLLGNRPDDRPPKLDNDLHRYWIERSRNPYITEFFERHSPYYAALFDLAAPQTSEVAAMARQHRAILLELIAGDLVAAREALSAHIRAQRPIVRSFMNRLKRLGDEPQERPGRGLAAVTDD